MHFEQKSSFYRIIQNFKCQQITFDNYKYLENHGKQRVQEPTIIINHIKLAKNTISNNHTWAILGLEYI